MNRWIPYAFVRIAIFFMSGICLGIYYPDLLSLRYTAFIFLGFVLLYGIIAYCFWWRLWPAGINLKFCAGAVGLSAIFLAGFINTVSHTHSRKSGHLLQVKSSIEFFKAVITSGPKEKAQSWKTEATVKAIKTDGEWRECEANLIIYLSKEDFPLPFEYGDVILVKGDPQIVSSPANPEEFDYKRFLNFKNIYHQQFVRHGQVKRIGFAPESWVDHYALMTRRWADEALRGNISGDREKALASALVLGVTDGLDDELLSAYKATGTLHVLAVSGLHVGILYGLVLFMLGPLNKLKFGPWTLAVISIVILWAYAFVTGLSPSVLRAVTMFSFLAIAKPAGRHTNIYNTLAASAFCILWYDPFLIMSVGFQLSYLAVLGIVYIQPGLYNLWEPTNRVLDEIWKISCVSVAAQFSTLALGLLYFHQFPNYFLISNLFVIPGSFVVLILGLLMLATVLIQPIASALGFLLEWVIKAMNYVIFALEDLPFSLVENVYISPLQCWLLIGIFISILLLIQKKKFEWAVVSFFIGVVFSLTQWLHFNKDVNIQKITIYNVPGHTAMDLMDRGQVYFIGDSAMRADPDKIGFHITPNRVKAGSKSIFSGSAFLRQLPGCALMVWKGRTFLQIHDPVFSLPDGLRVDYVIASNNAVNNLVDLVKQVHTNGIILDSSNSKFLATKILQQNKTIQAKIYSVLHEGAFELNI